jgi:hypothetical protein
MVINNQVEHADELIGRAHENGWVVDVDMAAHVARYVQMVRTQYGMTVRAEKFVRLNSMIAGTCDAWAVLTFIDDKRTLVVVDLKYGFGVVEVWQNPQLSIYAGALVREMAAQGSAVDQVRLVVHQPRAYHPHGHTRTWTVPVAELMQYVAWIEQSGQGCQVDNPVAAAGAHCHNCDAAATCGALAAANYKNVETMWASDQRHMTGIELATELRFLDDAQAMVDSRRNEVAAEAEARIKRGEAIPGYGLVRGVSQRRLKVSASVIQQVFGVSATSDKIVTPAELVRRLKDARIGKTGQIESVVNALSENVEGKSRLTALPPDHAQRAFGQT